MSECLVQVIMTTENRTQRCEIYRVHQGSDHGDEESLCDVKIVTECPGVVKSVECLVGVTTVMSRSVM